MYIYTGSIKYKSRRNYMYMYLGHEIFNDITTKLLCDKKIEIKLDPIHSLQFTSLDYSAYLEECSAVLVRRLLTYHATPSPIKRPPTRSWAIPQLTSDSLTRSNTPPALVVDSFFDSDAFPASVSGVGVGASFSIPAVKYQHILSHVKGPP